MIDNEKDKKVERKKRNGNTKKKLSSWLSCEGDITNICRAGQIKLKWLKILAF